MRSNGGLDRLEDFALSRSSPQITSDAIAHSIFPLRHFDAGIKPLEIITQNHEVMKTMRHNLLAKLHILLKQQNAEQHKEAIYSAYGVASSKDMSDAQLSHLIGRLEGSTINVQSPLPTIDTNVVVVDSFEVKKLRSEILSLITKSPCATNHRQRGLGVPNDWAILNPFIVRHGHKLLFQMNAVELDTFRRKLLAMRESGWSYREDRLIPRSLAPTVKSAPTPQPHRDYLIMPTGKVLS